MNNNKKIINKYKNELKEIKQNPEEDRREFLFYIKFAKNEVGIRSSFIINENRIS